MDEFPGMILDDLLGIGERMRDLCSDWVPQSLTRYTGSQLRMIKRIYELTGHRNEGIQLKTLAAVLKITPAATSEMVETLVRRGALERRVDNRDRRAMALRLSPELEQRFRDSEARLAEMIGCFFDTKTAEERSKFAAVISELNEHLQKISKFEEAK